MIEFFLIGVILGIGISTILIAVVQYVEYLREKKYLRAHHVSEEYIEEI